MPQVLDPFFHRSVVLLLRHGEEGSVGFIVNRRMESRIAELLQPMGVKWGGKPELSVNFGGPVQPHLGTVLYDGEQVDFTQADEEAFGTAPLEGVRITRHLSDLGRLAERPPESFRLILGYAGWGPGQLWKEILRNDWLTAPVRKELLFRSDADATWEAALRSVGVNPEVLPSWTPGSDEGPVA